MWSKAVWLGPVLLWAASASAQTVTLNANYLRLLDGPCRISSSNGSPDKLVLTDCPVITTSAATNMTLDPTGDLVLGPDGSDILPDVGYTQNLGALSNKYLTLHAAELWVETLVAQNTIATIGGRVLVAPTTTLTVDLAPAATTITVKHNEMASGDRVYLEADGKVEWMAITSAPSGGGPYAYTVTRNLDGSGANQWYAGDAVLNSGTTGDGFIDLYSFSGVLSGSGPTIVGNVRTGTTYSNVAPRWAIGNLNGLYGYGATTYGTAFGDSTATNVTIDATNGFRIRSSTTNKFSADTSGNLSLAGDLSMSSTGIIRSSSATAFGTGDGFWLEGGASPKFRIGNPSGNKLTYETSTGILSLTGNGGGLTSIGPGSLILGTGRNMLRNSDCSVGTVDWTNGTNTSLTMTLSFGLAGYMLKGLSGTCYYTLAGTPSVGQISYGFITTNERFPVITGQVYEASAYLGVHRSGNTTVDIQWYNSAGTFLSQSTGSACTSASLGGEELEDFCRSFVIATAPANATTANVMVITTHTAELNPYVFWVHAYFGQATSAQTSATNWAPAGLTEIVGGVIKTGTIVADNIAASTITGAKIAASTITASNIAASTITATQIAASTITADKLSVSTLSAITANLGTVTAGTIDGATINAGTGDEVVLNSSGITISQGTGTNNAIKWGSDYIRGSSTTLTVLSVNDVLVTGVNVVLNGTTSTRITGLSSAGTRYVCAASDGTLSVGTSC